MSCNTAQNEIGGKDLLLKVCKDLTATTPATGSNLTITAHGLKIGDLVKFGAIGTNTTIDTVTYYFVKTVVDANTVTIAETPTGTAIAFDDAEAGVAIEVFVNVGGLRAKSVSLSADGIDITNSDSDQWKTLLDGAGIRGASVSGDGVYNNASAFGLVEDAWLANALKCLAFVDVKGGKVITACFKITSLEYSGSYDAEGTFSLSAESSGAVTIQKV